MIVQVPEDGAGSWGGELGWEEAVACHAPAESHIKVILVLALVLMLILMMVLMLMVVLSHHKIINDHEGDVGIAVGVGRFCLVKPYKLVMEVHYETLL